MPPGVTVEAPLSVSAAGFGCRVRGLDLSQDLPPPTVQFLLELFHEHKVLCVAGQDIDGSFSLAHFERFANHIGAPLPHPAVTTRYRERPALQVQSNVVGYWRPGLAAGHELKKPSPPSFGWHADIDYEQVPSSATIFVCHTATPTADNSGKTHFINLESLLKTLPSSLAAAADNIQVERTEPASVSPTFETAAALNDADSLTPLVIEHPFSGRRTLYGSLFGARRTVFSGAAPDVIQEVLAAIQPLEERSDLAAHTYSHEHQRGDVVMWDNYSLWHRAPAQVMVPTVDSPGARLLYRCSVKGQPSLMLPRSDSEEWLQTHIAGAYRTPLSDILEPASEAIPVARGAGILEILKESDMDEIKRSYPDHLAASMRKAATGLGGEVEDGS